ncbi:MAG: P-type conjugative transfer protein TrbG [Sphingomonas sp. 28-66-16]|nr:MAG: P-type conjugative transfer protein TrbG [Sphingomonas sp. 28-66-16]
MNRICVIPLLAAIACTSIAADAPSVQQKIVPEAARPKATQPQAVTPPPKAASSPAKAKSIRHRAVHRRQKREIAGVAAANRSATLEPASAGFVNAVQIYPFADGLVFQVYTAPGRVTDIALQPGETLVAVASGDTVRWVIGDTTSGAGADKRTHILVKPFTAGLATNLFITTDRRSYHLALTSTARTAMAAMSWTYPQDALIALKRIEVEAEAAAPLASGLDIDQLRFDYVISGDKPAWRPLRAFDDGRQTFVEFPATLGAGEAPPLFLVDRKGDAQLVNYRLRGRYYIVDRLFDVAELRLGSKHQEIVRITRIAATGGRRAS